MAAGGAGVAADIISEVLGKVGDQISSAQMAQQENRWNQMNYGHRYQAQVQDLRAAGLNPILAAQQGAPSMPAVTGTGSSGGMHTNIAQSLSAAKMTEAEIRKSDSEVLLNSALTKKANSEISNIDAMTGKTIKEQGLVSAQEAGEVEKKALTFKEGKEIEDRLRTAVLDRQMTRLEMQKIIYEMPALKGQYELYKSTVGSAAMPFIDWLAKKIPGVSPVIAPGLSKPRITNIYK